MPFLRLVSLPFIKIGALNHRRIRRSVTGHFKNVKPQYTIRVPWYRLLPVDFIHYLIFKKCIHECKAFLYCLPHDKPACLVLIGSIYSNNLPIKDFNLLEYFVSFDTIKCPYWAHTTCCFQCGVR